MAINYPTAAKDAYDSYYNNTVTIANTSSISTKAIRGELISIEREVPADTMVGTSPNDIKMAMVAQLAGELIKSKHVYFTSQLDPITGNYRVRARLYVTPDDQTQTIVLNK